MPTTSGTHLIDKRKNCSAERLNSFLYTMKKGQEKLSVLLTFRLSLTLFA